MTEKNKQKTVFVICPLGKKDSVERKRSDIILKHVISKVVNKFGYVTVRADKISKPGIITSQIVDHILNDHLVIADLTGQNPNVFYELAIRHVIKKPIIQMIQQGEKIPFDVSTQRTIEIDHTNLDSVEEAKGELEKQIKAVEKDPSLVDSPVSVAINLSSLKESADPEQTALFELQSSLSLIKNDIREIRNIVANPLQNHESNKGQYYESLHPSDRIISRRSSPLSGEYEDVYVTTNGKIIRKKVPLKYRVDPEESKKSKKKKVEFIR